MNFTKCPNIITIDDYNKIHDYEKIKKLGEGGYSEVFLVRNKNNGKEYALKVISRYVNRKDKRDRILQEIKVLKMCDHPNIIKLYDWFEYGGNYHLVLEYINCRDLGHKFADNIPDQNEALSIIRQIASAIKYCHDKNIIHRDIKLANVLIDNNGNIKLTDFGLCIIKKYKDDVYRTDAGTMKFKAPEIFLRHDYNESIDIWSFGVLIYVLLIGKYPFDGNKEEIIRKEIIRGRVPLRHESLTQPQMHLLKHMLVIDPVDRYTINDVVNHNWLSQKLCNNCKNKLD